MDQHKKNPRRRSVSFSDVKLDRSEKLFPKRRDNIKSQSFRREIEIMENKSKESEFAASIAAAAYAIYSLEETRAEFERRMVESFREDPAALTIKTRKDSQDTNTFEFPDLETLMKRTSLLERRDNNEGNQSSIMKTSTRGIEISGVEQEQRSRRKEMTKAEAWEQARLAKIHKWYEKIKDKITEWETEKKKKAAIDMEKRKEELERLKRLNYHHYGNKMDKIENVARGAMKQLEDKKTSEEAYAKQQANKIRFGNLQFT
ncbi:uncharacterized protein LOC130797608 isoform X2 [Amaranthus tricolor]|uniref:uncharacterized protein LOC130797608 isoform X2 n=1 Tax=Amaranthus tricolor TaxID=29722 RepID=UPI0025891165|nr:uncharacterized protein LOC130797608 isoform X2 [Amaranthus tricolor]